MLAGPVLLIRCCCRSRRIGGIQKRRLWSFISFVTSTTQSLQVVVQAAEGLERERWWIMVGLLCLVMLYASQLPMRSWAQNLNYSFSNDAVKIKDVVAVGVEPRVPERKEDARS